MCKKYFEIRNKNKKLMGVKNKESWSNKVSASFTIPKAFLRKAMLSSIQKVNDLKGLNIRYRKDDAATWLLIFSGSDDFYLVHIVNYMANKALV